jgi:hypothetical protein
MKLSTIIKKVIGAFKKRATEDVNDPAQVLQTMESFKDTFELWNGKDAVLDEQEEDAEIQGKLFKPSNQQLEETLTLMRLDNNKELLGSVVNAIKSKLLSL